MAPQERESDISLIERPVQEPAKVNEKWSIVWRNVILFTVFHTVGMYGLYVFFFKLKWLTFFFVIFVGHIAGLGITAGAHRLWAHKSYKATLLLRVILLFFNTICLQGTVIDWVRDHRMHHKYSETNADPHNATRGFFFSHIGWLLIRKHPDIKAKGHTVDMSDITNDPCLRFQKRYYAILAPLACFVLPTYIATLWGEPLMNALVTCAFGRCMILWHATYLVNSWAHLWGSKPYDKYINPVESKFVAYVTLGEGHHNYHHVFPWDYKTAEVNGYLFNYTGVFINLMANIGLAYDLKTVSEDVIRQRVERTGDGSHHIWGWNDKNISKEERKAALIFYPEKNKKVN